MKKHFGYSIVELVLAMGLATLIFPAILSGVMTTRQGKPQEIQLNQGQSLLTEGQEAVRSIRNNGWTLFAVNGTYHPVVTSGKWGLAAGSEVVNGLTRKIVVADVYRDPTGAVITTGGGTLDPSSKLVTLTVSWTQPYTYSLSTSSYLTRYKGTFSWTQTTMNDFNAGTLSNVQVASTSGIPNDGQVSLVNNNKARWCSPSYSPTTIDLPDGPPVSVVATASATNVNIPNDVFVATAPNDSSSIKLAYVNVTANTATPAATLRGTFTLDPTKYSTSSAVPTGLAITNSFKTNGVKYYTSSGGNLYALLATDLPNQEVVVVKIKNSDGTDAYQDDTNQIYKYWTFFNTRRYQGDNSSTPNQDQAPYGTGASSIATLGTRGYITSGGFLYVIDLSNIDSKTPSTGLDEVGCRIELDGFDCNPTTSKITKYAAGKTGMTFQPESAGQPACYDGGTTAIYADYDISPVQSNGHTYVYVAVGAGVDPEFEIVDTTTVPTNSTSPKVSDQYCGALSNNANTGWKRTTNTVDFDSLGGTQESANSVFARSDGKRAYVSSNGGVDANHDGIPDSDQFYVINTSNPNSPVFLSKSSNQTGNIAASGYYNGIGANLHLFPRRSLTVLNGQRAVIVGQKDPNYTIDGTHSEPQEYQVINLDNESTPMYCGGVNDTYGFNDLTSVSEANGDNYVYMVENSNQKQLKIIQGGPDNNIYADTGTFTSSALSSTAAFNHFAATVNQPASATIKMQIASADADSNGLCTNANFSFIGPDGTSSTFFTPTGSTISGTIPFISSGNYKNPGKCIKYQTTFLTSPDKTQTPTLYDTTVNYSP